MDAGVRPASRVLLQFHPARKLSRHRRRVSGGGAAAEPAGLVSARPARRDPRRRPVAAGSGAAEHVDDLFLERHGGSRRPGRKHAAAAAALHLRRRVVRDRGAAHGPRALGQASTAGLRDQPAGQPHGRRRVRAGLVAAASAARVVRCRVGRGAAVHRAGPAARRRRQHRAARLRPGDRASHGGRQPVVAVLPHHDISGPIGHRGGSEPHLPPVDGARRDEGIFLSVAVHRLRRFVRRGVDPRRGDRHRRRGGARAWGEARDRRRHRPCDSPAGGGTASRSAVQRSARHGDLRRCPAFSEDIHEQVRPRGVCPDRLADRAIELLRRAPRELHVHEGIVSGRARSPLAAGCDGALQLFPREVAGRSARQHRRRRIRTGATRPRSPGSGVPRRHAGGTASRRACRGAAAAARRPRVRAVAGAEPRRPALARPERRAGDRRLAVSLHAIATTAAPLRRGARPGPHGVGAGRLAGAR